MFNPSSSERLLKRIKNYVSPVLQPIRRKKLNNTDFTIISNNCWGGVCYEYFGMEKATPTVGMFFFASDYLRFLRKLDWYLEQELIVIDPVESGIYDKLVKMDSTGGLVGILGDIEIVLLHYHDKQIALDKWNRRVKRINRNNLIVKFAYQNECTYDQLKEFDDMDLSYFSNNYKKLMFVPKPMPEFKSAIYYKGFEKEEYVLNDTFYFNRYLELIPFINGEGLIQK